MADNNNSLSTIAEKVAGELRGNKNLVISGICSLDEPKTNFISFAKEIPKAKFAELIKLSETTPLIISSRWSKSEFPREANVILVKDPLLAIVSLIPLFFPAEVPSRTVSSKADIHPTAKIGQNVTIGAFCAIGEDVVIEDGAVVHPNVTLYRGVRVGKDAVIHSGVVVRELCIIGKGATIQNGAVIGADGFGYVNEFSEDGAPSLRKVPQVGNVVLGPSSEIGANSCIDRATLGTTEVGAHTKIDNLVQVGHNTKIGKFSILCGQVGVAGSAKIGNGVILGGAVGVRDHATIVDGCRFAARSGVVGDITEKGDYAGYPAQPSFAWRRHVKLIAQLPEIIEELREKKNRKTK